MKLRLWEWCAIGGVFLSAQILARCEGTSFYDYSMAVPVLSIPFVLFLYGRIRKVEAIAEIGEYIVLWICYTLVNAMFAYAVAEWRLPLRDTELAGIDSMIGFNRVAVLHLVTASSWMRDILSIAYGSLFAQTMFSVLYFALNDFSDRNRELFRIAAIACVASSLISGIAPAIGPYPPLASFQQALIDVRNNNTPSISIPNMQGIVTFPSFHTAMAVFFIYAHRPPCRSFLPILALNLLLLMAVPTWGHHYFIDEIAGATLALVCISVSNWLTSHSSVVEGHPSRAEPGAVRQ